MRKSFTRLFGFLLLSVMMLFSYGLYALPDGGTSTETQSTIELKAPAITQCYKLANSYSAVVQVKDFVDLRSFSLTLKYDPAVFAFTSATPVTALTSGWQAPVFDNTAGTVTLKWTVASDANPGVTLVDNAFANAFTVNFSLVSLPTAVTSYASTLTWAAGSSFYYGANYTGTAPVQTTVLTNGSLTVPVQVAVPEVSVTSAACYGTAAAATVTSPVGAGYVYYFNGSATGTATPTVGVFAPSSGNSVVVVNAEGCASPAKTFSVAATASLTWDVEHTDPVCVNGNGSITFTYSGGAAPYTFWVVPANVSATFMLAWATNNTEVLNKYNIYTTNNLVPAGNYLTLVTSGNCPKPNFESAGFKPVTVLPAPSVQVEVDTDPATCTAEGSINVSVGSEGEGSEGEYKVSIDNGQTWTSTVNGSTAFAVAGGTYTLTVMNTEGCVVTNTTVTVGAPDPIKFTVAYTDASCFEGTTGSATVTVTNAIEGHTYRYAIPLQSAGYTVATIGATLTWTADGEPTNGLVPNYYSVFVQDQTTGCIAAYVNDTQSGNIVPIQKPDALGFKASVSAITCAGTATITVTPSGGHTPYSYAFSVTPASTTSNSTSYSAVYSLAPEATLTVSVTVIDGNGTCSITQSVSIVAPAELTATIATDELNQVISPSCPGGTNGRVTVNASGGVAPYKYASDGVTFRENNVLAIPEGAFTITVMDSNSCTTTVSGDAGTVTPTTISVATPAKIACVGGTTSLSVTGTWPDGRSVIYYYATSAAAVYSGGTAFIPYSTGALPAATGTPTAFTAGTYYIGAKDKLFDCEAAVTSVTISENPALAATVTKVKDATCAGLQDGLLTISTTGGTGTVTYSLGNTANQALNAYTVTGTIQAMDTYSATTQTSTKTVGLARGTYYVVVWDQCGHSEAYGPINIDGYKPIDFTGTVAKTPSTCFDSKDGKITVPLAGVSGGKPEFDGTGSYVFTLTKPGGTTTSTTTGSFTGLVGGQYTVTITDASSCTSSKTISVSFEDPKQLLVTGVAVKHISCKGLNDGEIVLTTNGGGVGPYKMAINSSALESAFPFGEGAVSKPYVATQPGVFNLYVWDSNNCPANTVSVTVAEPEALTASVTVGNQTCESATSGSATVVAVGGWNKLVGVVTPTYSYNYTVGGTATSTSPAVFTGLAVGSYVASVADVTSGTVSGTIVTVTTTTATITYTYPAISCKATTNFQVKPVEAYTYTGVASPVKCKGGNDGALLITVKTGSQAVVDPTTGPEYYVQLTSTATPTLVASDWKLTKNQKYEFTGLVHGHYTAWIANKNTVAGTTTGTTSIYNQGACVLPVGSEPFNQNQSGPYMFAESWEIQEPLTALTASGTWVSDVACDGSKGGSFTIGATGGSPEYTYAAVRSIFKDEAGVVHHVYVTPTSSDWQASNAFEDKAAGTWVIWVKDTNGCVVGGETDTTTGLPVDKYRVQIKNPEPIAFTAVKTKDVTCYAANNGTITITPADATRAPFTYVITGTDYTGAIVSISGVTTSTVQTSYVVTDIPANTTSGTTATNVYTVTLTDRNNCTASSTTLVSQVKQPQQLTGTLVKAAGYFKCPGDINGVIELQGLGGGVKDYKYQLWRDGVQYSPTTGYGVIPSYIVGVGYTYTAIVTDAVGCTISSTLELDAPKAVEAEMKETTCYGDATASAIIVATGEEGRTFQYRYRLNTDPEFASATAGWKAVTEDPVSGFIFANVNPEQNFYYFEIKDNQGCTTSKTYSFVPTQIKFEATVAGLGSTATVTVAGGIGKTTKEPYYYYAYALGTAATWAEAIQQPGVVSGGSFAITNGLVDGLNTIKVFDAHGCSVTTTYTADITAPTATYAPNGTTTPTTDNHPELVITFSEDVVAGAGTITIKKKSDDTPAIAAIPVSALTISGKTATVTYAGGLDRNTEYYVVIDAGVVKDLAGNDFAGVTSSTTWTFKTGNEFKTGVDPEPVNTLEFKVYPNPFVDHVTIKNVSELSKVVVSNIAGQVVKEVVNPTGDIQLSELRSGVYFITLYQDSKVVSTVKLLKR